MQVPERLALIGGSILLASTLVFTLKSQASQILPKISKASSKIYDHIGDAKSTSDFNDGYREAQQKGWTTGQWGSSKYYINDQGDMHVGSGDLQGTLNSILGGDSGTDKLRSINIDQPVKAPQDSSLLFAGGSRDWDKNNSSIQAINGLNQVDTSQVQNMYLMLGKNASVQSLDVSDWDVSHVTNMQGMFIDSLKLTHLNIQGWNPQSVNNMSWMFTANTSLTDLDLSNFHISKGTNTSALLNWTGQLRHLRLSNDFYLQSDAGINGSGSWKQGDTTLKSVGIQDSNSHPGTWTWNP